MRCTWLAIVAVCAGIVGCSDARTEERTREAPISQMAELEIDGPRYLVPDSYRNAAIGDPIAVGRLAPTPRLANARRTRVLYRSEDRDGRAVAVSGVVLVPDAPVPEGGWPVVSWAHGTTGVADVCTPSRTDNLFYNEYAQEVSTLLSRGYAVVATDYLGLGTAEGHSYMVGEDEANAVIDIVTAARHLEPSLGRSWFAVGHSQGGQAALFANRAKQRASELDLRGTVAMAPGAGLDLALPVILAGGLPSDVTYAVYLLVGLATVDTTFDPLSALGPEGVKRRDLFLDSGCLLDGIADLATVPISAIFNLSAADLTKRSAQMAAYGNPDAAPTTGAVLVVQGAEDHDVPAAITQRTVARLQALGSEVNYREYPDTNHDEVLGASICDRLAWMADQGGAPLGACTPYATDLT